MTKTVVTRNAHLEELAPTPAKLTKLTGYDTLDPNETRAYIAEVLRVYSKQNKPYKIRSRRNPKFPSAAPEYPFQAYRSG